MKAYKIKNIISISFLIVILLAGCKKILSPKLQGQIALSDLVQDQSGIITILNGVYAPLIDLYNGPMERLTDLASDDGWTWRNELEPDLFIVTQTFAYSTEVWADCYKGIDNANAVLANVDGVKDFSSTAIKNSVKGQAFFMRAFYNFNLVRLFGGVPLIVKQIDQRSDAELPRATMQDTYMQIESDLDSAVALLPTSYNNSPNMEAGRPTTYSARALQALVYLETNDWNNVVTSADVVINSTKFGLLTNYADNFDGESENGPQSLFEVQYSGTSPSTSSNMSVFYAPPDFLGSALILPTDDSLYGGGGGPSSGGQSFVQAIENGDLRKNVIIATYDLPNFIQASRAPGTLFFVNKYANASEPVGRSSWNYPLIRYAEILLAKSEALNENGYTPDGDAFNLLNQVRAKAGLAPYTSIDLPNQDAFRLALQQERRIELSFECKRFFDLNRWGILGSSVQPQLNYLTITYPANREITNPFSNKKYFLYPIPGTEFVNNARLGEQNPGYN